MPELNLKKIKKVHFIGIGGIGISAIARMMLKRGKAISGSDRSRSIITDELKKLGARIFIGQKALQVPKGADLVIYTIAIPANNPELARAKSLSIPLMTYPQALGAISRDHFTIAVSGTHGKTTTTAMIGGIFRDAKKDPTVIVGSLMGKARSNLVAGRGRYFIVEACEYKRSFLNLEPKIIVITNIDNDHLDYYKNIGGIQKAFSEFVSKLSKDDYLVTDEKNPAIIQVVKKARCRVADFKKESVKGLTLLVPGKHNVLNAQAALAVAKIAGISRACALKSLASFKGTWRRFEFKGKTKSGALVYDDYGHHPTEIKATLAAAREFMRKTKDGPKKLVVVFQPHLYSRTRLLFKGFADSFGQADETVFVPIYAAREIDDKTVSSAMLAQAVKRRGVRARSVEGFKEAEKLLSEFTGKEYLILTMGAGDVHKIGEALVKLKPER